MLGSTISRAVLEQDKLQSHGVRDGIAPTPGRYGEPMLEAQNLASHDVRDGIAADDQHKNYLSNKPERFSLALFHERLK